MFWEIAKAHEMFLTVSPVCGHRNERSGSLLHLSADVEWSGRKLASQASPLVRGPNSAEAPQASLGVKRAGGVRAAQAIGDAKRQASESKYPLCEARGENAET
jgi:hypothetical protein